MIDAIDFWTLTKKSDKNMRLDLIVHSIESILIPNDKTVQKRITCIEIIKIGILWFKGRIYRLSTSSKWNLFRL